MRVTVHVLHARLMHVPMAVLGAVGVGVGVFVLDVLVLVRGVRVRVGDAAMLVFVRVGRVVGVLLGHRCRLLTSNALCCVPFHLVPVRPGLDPPTACSPPSLRW
ncbi:hypothetical protein MSEO_32720 [Mycobacterium seoulense]|uniref:Uncharacterized protein n=1 Tax=Mycobacterium seoulense TaxID=386911 RepID=A0A7I7P1L9_9MYCO|nr:hypothetical protein MSEO_32720 [Mycobacterium seoulense]